MAQAIDSIRRGATSTARSVSEQATAADQISRSGEALARQASQVARAMSEQSTATNQLTTVAAAMRQDAEQAARGLADQTRAIRDISTTTASTAKQIRLIHAANREHSIVANDLLSRIKEVREVAEQNAQHDAEVATAAPRSSNGGGRRAPRSNGSR